MADGRVRQWAKICHINTSLLPMAGTTTQIGYGGCQNLPCHGRHLITLIKIHKEKQSSLIENLSGYIPMKYKIRDETLRRTQARSTLTISGNCVSCSTLVTATPALSNAEAVPPVETIVNLTLEKM
jgi:hypothetical protein